MAQRGNDTDASNTLQQTPSRNERNLQRMPSGSQVEAKLHLQERKGVAQVSKGDKGISLVGHHRDLSCFAPASTQARKPAHVRVGGGREAQPAGAPRAPGTRRTSPFPMAFAVGWSRRGETVAGRKPNWGKGQPARTRHLLGVRLCDCGVRRSCRDVRDTGRGPRQGPPPQTGLENMLSGQET